MLRQCISPDQHNWVSKLPGIEFAINSASSQTTGYTPFMLNYGLMPQSMIWNSDSEYHGVCVFAQKMKNAVLAAHDTIITARVNQTRLANNRRKESPFAKGDFVYLSMQNLSLPKGQAQKLAPKFVGPFKILEDYKNNTFLLDLPAELKQHGIHPVFHAHLLRIHVPNDDRWFPGRQLSQIMSLGKTEEWAVSSINTHHGKGTDALFELTWKSGDCAWLPYHKISHLEAPTQYLEAQGATNISQLLRHITKDNNLPIRRISPANHKIMQNLVTEVINSSCEYATRGGNANHSTNKVRGSTYKGQLGYQQGSPLTCPKMSNTLEDVVKYTAFGNLIKSSQYEPGLHPIPDGYLEYSVKYQHCPAEALPFPPEVGVDIIIIEGLETRVLQNRVVIPSTQELDETARAAQNECVY
jgi:hypothetical protein